MANPPGAVEDANINHFIRPPKPLIIEHDKDMAKAWKLWKQQYSYFETAAMMVNKPQNIQIATFMSTIGPTAIQLYNTLPQPDIPARGELTLAQVKNLFENYFIPRVNVTFERYKFHKIFQCDNETIDELMSRLRLQAQNCAFENLIDGMLRDQLILGIKNDELRTRLLSQDITLEQAIVKCKATEIAQQQTAHITQETEKGVSFVRKQSKANNVITDCRNCAKTHKLRKCPAFRHKCKICSKENHFESCCSKPRTNKSSYNRDKTVKAVVCDQESDASDDNSWSAFIGKVSIPTTPKESNQDPKLWTEEIHFEFGKKCKIYLDTGAECNVLPMKLLNGTNNALQQCKIKSLRSFANHQIKVLGEVVLKSTIANQKCRIAFKVVEEDIMPILGANACEKLGLIRRIYSIKKEEIFNGLGCIKNVEYDIDLIPNPSFEICAPRRIPYKIRDDVKKALDEMVDLDVIEPIKEPTPAVSPMVVVKKNNKIRICIDPTIVNKNILRRHHPMTTIEDIAARINGSKFFTLLDCRRGFWQVRVSDRTKRILTFATPWGRYCCKRLPFGISSAPEVFQRIMQELFTDLPKVEVAIDDILIHARTIEELRRTTEKVLTIIQANGLKLNKEKCQFEQSKIKFLGHIIDHKGMSADPEKTEAIRRLKPPTNRKELQRILGKFTYLSKFIPNYSQMMTPLRKLLEKSTQWVWDEIQQKSFEELKEIITKPPVLKLYDVNQDVKLQVDASSSALGAVLLQQEQPVAYASKSLTECQQRYSQLEKEALAIKFGCEKFHEYVWGKQPIVESDHKPLESIFQKPLHACPARLQRIRLSLLTYNPKVIYIKGSKMFLADPLSRDVENPPPVNDREDNGLQVQSVLAITDAEHSRLAKLTAADESCQQLFKYISKGWPNNIQQLPESIKPYWYFREELSVCDGVIHKSHKTLIPEAMRYEMLKYIHGGHLSYEKCIRHARDYVFWPKLNKDLQNFIQKCASCQVHQRNNNKHPIESKDVPKFPFEIVATDLFHFLGEEYIVLTDSYSGFITFEKLMETTASNVIKFLKNIFAYHGIPKVLESDNGPQFSSVDFKNFAKLWQFDHHTSSPHHPRGNGLAERAVQTAKQLLKKCHYDNTDYHLAILNFMNTPRGNIGTPAQRLYCRNLRSQIPATTQSLIPSHQNNITEELKNMRHNQALNNSQGSTPPQQLNIGQNVLTRIDKREWEPAVVKEKIHSRSYNLEFNNGKVLRRNITNIKPTEAKVYQKPNLNLDESEAIQNVPSSENPTTSANPTTTTQAENQQVNSPQISTRSGRTIRRPLRLDL